MVYALFGSISKCVNSNIITVLRFNVIYLCFTLADSSITTLSFSTAQFVNWADYPDKKNRIVMQTLNILFKCFKVCQHYIIYNHICSCI